MRVLFLGQGNPIPTFILRRLRQLDQAGIKCIIPLSTDQRISEKLENVEFIPNYKVRRNNFWYIFPVAFFQFLISGPKSWRILAFAKGNLLYRLKWSFENFVYLRINRPDIIHLQWISMADDYHWLKKIYQCPIIASARGSQVTVYPSTNINYKEKVKRCVQQVDYIHCVSEDILKTCLELGAERHKLFVNYNGIDLNLISPNNKRVEKNPVILISVGSLIWRKGYLFQLQVLHDLLSANIDATLVIIGAGPDEAGLRYSAFRMGIQDKVLFKGQLSFDQIKQELDEADIYLSTSAAEGLSNSVMEAAAAALPIVAFDCEGMSEIMVDGESGFIVPFGDVQLFTEKVSALAKNPEYRITMGKMGRKHIEQNFAADKCLEEMIQVYSKISANG